MSVFESTTDRKINDKNMNLLSGIAVKNITKAQAALEGCLHHPEKSPELIQKAIRHSVEANQWIVARVLLNDYRKREKIRRLRERQSR